MGAIGEDRGGDKQLLRLRLKRLTNHWPARLEGYDSWVFGSYGLYVWGFPVQQLLIMAGADTQWSLTVTALPLTYLCGWLSWRYIEAPTFVVAPLPSARQATSRR